MALCHKWDVKNDFAYVLQFFSLISDILEVVWGEYGFHIVFTYGCFVFVQYCTARTEFNKTFICLIRKFKLFCHVYCMASGTFFYHEHIMISTKGHKDFQVELITSDLFVGYIKKNKNLLKLKLFGFLEAFPW